MTSTSQKTGNRFKLPKRYENNPPSVVFEFVQLAIEHKPLNLGAGFTDYPIPRHITEALLTSSDGNPLLNQYSRSRGHPRLVQALAKLYSTLTNRNIDAFKEVLVTVGGSEALYTAIQGHIEVGDEVILIEPFYDCYEPMVKIAGGIPRCIPLRPTKADNISGSSSNWVLDWNELESMFNEKTKMIIVNTPTNPIGKVFKQDELEKIATLCQKWNVLCLADEVYEWVVYDGNKHIRMCTLPGMWERTITIGSAGKTFSVTGWKIGWAYGPAKLLENLQIIHESSVFTVATPLQEAVAIAFEKELPRLDTKECYFNTLSAELSLKRDFLVKALNNVGMKAVVPEGAYFLLADWSTLASKADLSEETDSRRDYRFTKWMIKALGLQGIPPSAFYTEKHKHLAEDYVRFCFFKKDENLQKAAEILQNWK